MAQPDVSSFLPLDSIISGYAYENATTALGVLEEGAGAKRWISAEMLCTLDNFIKVVLFSDRIFFDGCAGEKEGRVVPEAAVFGASEKAGRIFDESGIFHPITRFNSDSERVNSRLAEILAPLKPWSDPWFVLTCAYKQRPLTIRQEMVTMDAFLIEHLIEHGGVDKFKPVFPGEHLYLGLRQARVKSPLATHSIADASARRVRIIVSEKMQELNKLVALGAPPIPALPPLFTSRIAHDVTKTSYFGRLLGASAQGGIVETLFEIRNSAAMIRFRNWARKCMEMIASEDVNERQRAASAYEKLTNLSFKEPISADEFGKSVLDIAGDAIKGDVLGILTEVVAPVMKYLGGFPLWMLRDLGGSKGETKQIGLLLEKTFGDKFNRGEMDYIATLLSLPDNLTDWQKMEVEFKTEAARIDPLAPNLSRPCFISTGSSLDVENAQKDWDELWKRAEPMGDIRKQEDEGKS